jgi:hypothetical protein
VTIEQQFIAVLKKENVIMEKKLIKSETELVDFFVNDLDLDPAKVEEYLGIEFAMESGRYMSDHKSDYDVLDELELEDEDPSKWRVVEEEGLPKSYPCVLVHYFEDTFDRLGNVGFAFFEYVYPSDFLNKIDEITS